MTVCLSTNGVNVHRDSSAPQRLLVATQRGINVITRTGTAKDWSPTETALDGFEISALMLEPGSGSLFAGAHDAGLFHSGDGGRTWSKRDVGEAAWIYSLRYFIENGAVILYAGTQPAGLFRSRDSGQTWVELTGFREAAHPEQWRFPAPGHSPHLKTIAVDPRNANVLYIGIEQGDLLKSIDGGVTWNVLEGYSRLDDRWYRDIHQVCLRPSNPDQIFMTTGLGLYYSPDAGRTWEHLTTADHRIGYPDQLIFSPYDDRTMYVSGAAEAPFFWRTSGRARGTVMTSRDGGRSWTMAADGLPEDMPSNVEAMSIAVFPGGFFLFAGTSDGSVFLSEHGGDSWSSIAHDLAPIAKPQHVELLTARP